MTDKAATGQAAAGGSDIAVQTPSRPASVPVIEEEVRE